MKRMLSFSIVPASSPRESAENTSSRTFWMITDSPKVIRSGDSGP